MTHGRRLATLLRSCLILLACASAAGAQFRRAQPLLGVGNTPAPAPPDTSADAFFSDDVVHELRLEINSKDWQALRDNYFANTYYPADFRWNGQVVRNIGIRSRGTASRSAVRPGLRVDFDRYADDQTFLGLKSVVLRNNLTDPSSMHERLSFKLMARLGLPVPRVAPTRLYINGQYEGLYSIVESPDKAYLLRVLKQNDGVLYKFDRNVGDEPYRFEFLGADPGLYVPHPFKPETNEDHPDAQAIADMVRAISNTPTDTFLAVVDQYLDLEGWIRQAAIENYLAESDGLVGDAGMNNFYLYELEGQKRHVWLAWDKSETFKSGPGYSVVRNFGDVEKPFRNRLQERLWEFPALQQLYYDTIAAAAISAGELVPGDERTWMEREVDREHAQIRDAVEADPTRAYSMQEFEAEVEALRIFARERPAFVRDDLLRHRP